MSCSFSFWCFSRVQDFQKQNELLILLLLLFTGIEFQVVKWVAHFASNTSQGSNIFRRKMSCSWCFYGKMCCSFCFWCFSRVQNIQMQNDLLMLLLLLFRGVGFPVVKWVAHFASDASQGCRIFRRKMSCSFCFYCFLGVYDFQW